MVELKKEKAFTSYRSLANNLTFLMEECKITLQELQVNTGVPLSTIHRMRSDPNCNPTLSTLKPIADFFSVSVSQLIGDEMISSDRPNGVYQVNTSKWNEVPLLEWANASNQQINNRSVVSKKTVSTEKILSAKAFALMIEDNDSIGFQQGAYILIEPTKIPKDKDWVLVKKENSTKPTIKHFISHDDLVYLMPVNPCFHPVIYNDEYEIVGVIVQIRLDIP